MERISSPLMKMCWEFNLFSFTEFEFDTELLDICILYTCVHVHTFTSGRRKADLDLQELAWWYSQPEPGVLLLNRNNFTKHLHQTRSLCDGRDKNKNAAQSWLKIDSRTCCSLSHKNGQTPLYSGSCEWPLLLEQWNAAYFSCTFVYPPSKVIPTEGVRKDASCQVLCILPLPWAAHPTCIQVQVCSWWSWAGEIHNI